MKDRPVVLVVDDAIENIATLGTALQGECEVRFATRGIQALEMAAAAPQPDLIMLDVVMPEMDGYEVCRRLKTLEETRGIPVIFLTSRDEESDEAEGFAAGAVDYIHKPFSTPLVRARVRTHVELKRKTDKLARTALLDGLTGIANRRRFDEAIEREWRRAIRSGQSLALIMIDVDFFKRFNDRYGHMAGDDCLVAVAQALDRTLGRASDLVARLGGEEFVALLPGCDVPNALQAAGRLQASVAELKIPHENSDCGSYVSLSMGVASTLPTPDTDPHSLLEAADRALYAAKAAGRNQASAEANAPVPAQAASPLEIVQRGGLESYLELEGFSDVRVELQDAFMEGDKVCCRFTFRGRHTGPFQGVGPTGREVSAAGLMVLRFAGERCAERWSAVDQLALLHQVGLLPA